MMTCKELAELMMDYCDGALPKEYCDLICQHMRHCDTCHNYMRILSNHCQDMPQPALPELPPHMLPKNCGRRSKISD